MKAIFWNIRGLGNVKSQLLFANYCRIHKPSWVAIAEPMIEFKSIPLHYWNSLGLKLVSVNSHAPLPNLWVLCNNSVSCSVKHCSDQCIIVNCLNGHHSFMIGFVYTNVRYTQRRTLWLELLNCTMDHLLLLGDFNAVLTRDLFTTLITELLARILQISSVRLICRISLTLVIFSLGPTDALLMVIWKLD